MQTRLLHASAVVITLLAGCGEASDASRSTTTRAAARIAVSNSYLEAAVLDVLDGREPVLRLAEPGMCPGHFDIRPSQVNELRTCRLLLRFDFQNSLDDKLAGLSHDGLRIREIHIPGGLCEPPSYLAACREVARTLVEAGLVERPAVDARLAAVEARVSAAGSSVREQIARSGWKGRSVVCSGHQERFCGWLGLRVAATFRGADTASVAEIEAAIRAGGAAGVDAVIANLPEGRRVADALGQRLNARVVVWGNFPLMRGGGPAFDELLASNVSALLEAAPR